MKGKSPVADTTAVHPKPIVDLYSTSLRITREDRDALLAEAIRRRQVGLTNKLDISGLVREALAAWRASL